MRRVSSPAALIAVFCLAQVTGMAGFATFAALLPGFLEEWALSKTEAGWLNGIFFAGYVAAVPVLVSLTDRVPPRWVYLVSMAFTVLAGLGFAVLAQGFWTALVFRVLSGFGLAGTYMPGLKILGDRLGGRAQSRAVAFYVSHFSIGWSFSFLIAGELDRLVGWHGAFALSAMGPVLSILLIALLVSADDPGLLRGRGSRLLDFRPVLRCREAMGYVLAYTVHNVELFAARSWIVVFLAFALARHPEAGAGWNLTLIATLFTIIGMPSSILGNELAVRFGRHRVIAAIMGTSAVLAASLGFLTVLPFEALIGLCLIYGITITGDSAPITAGVVAAAPPGYRGATMAVHSFIGFSGCFAGPLAFGVVLDLAGGGATVMAWGLAFAVIGAAVALGPVFLFLSKGDGGGGLTSAPEDGRRGRPR